MGAEKNLDNPEKREWRKKERRLRNAIILTLIALVILIFVIIKYSSQLWLIISGIAVILGMIADLISILKSKGEN